MPKQPLDFREAMRRAIDGFYVMYKWGHLSGVEAAMLIAWTGARPVQFGWDVIGKYDEEFAGADGQAALAEVAEEIGLYPGETEAQNWRYN